MTDINEILKEYVTLDIECIDRIYLNSYLPTLQMGGQLVKFIHHRGYEIPSPAILRQWTDAYKRAVESFAQAQGIEIIHFEKGTRKEEVAAKYRAEFEGEEGVLFIGIAQERAYAFQGRKKTKQKLVGFEYSRQSVFVNHYYFYLQDKEFGPAFIKVCSYAPSSMLSFLSSSLCIGEQTGSALVGV